MVTVKVRWLRPQEQGELPAYETTGSAGMDVAAALSAPLTVGPGEIVLVPTGLALAIPAGYEAQVRPRSGLAIRHGISVVNSPGTIDSDYRGEVKVGLINLGQQAYTIHPGDRIAQLVFAPVIQVELVEVEKLDDTARGAGGFGHTGVRRP